MRKGIYYFCRLFLLLPALLCAKEKLHFKENKGQWNELVQYRLDMNSGTLFIENSGITYLVYDVFQLHQIHELEHERIDVVHHPVDYHAYKVSFENANPAVFEERNAAAHREHYFTGNKSENWASNVSSFGEIRMNELYEGIDARLYSEAGFFKYDWIVHPGADVADIQMNYQGVEALELNDGNLIVRTSVNEIIEECPYAYQWVNGYEQQVNCLYRKEGNRISFEFPEGYNHNLPLYIDPIVMASTASGSTTTNYGHSAAFDDIGNIFSGARAFGAGYPTTLGAFQEDFGSSIDIAISKMDTTGSQLYWATYIGGSSSEWPHSMYVNEAGQIAVYGNTQSSNFPTSDTAFDDSYNGANDISLTVLSEDGASLIGSTYLGGSSDDGGANATYINYDDNYRGEILMDDDFNVYVSSYSSSTDFPTTEGALQEEKAGMQDGVLVKLLPDLSGLVWSSYIGGTADDNAHGIRVDDENNVYLSGVTESDDFPVTEGAWQELYGGGTGDAYIAKISEDGSTIEAATYYGSEEQDAAFFLDMDSNGDVYIFGQTQGDLSISTEVISDPDGRIFVAKFNPELDDLLKGTRVLNGGWSYPMIPTAFVIDELDNIYLSGYSAVAGLPVSANAIYETGGFYLMLLAPNMEGMIYGSYYTGGHVDGGTSRFDSKGIIYQAVCSLPAGFFIAEDAYSENVSSSWDVCVFKIDLELGRGASILEILVGDTDGCAPFAIDFESQCNYAINYEWDFGDGGESTEENPSYVFEEPGEYEVMLIADNYTGSWTGFDTTYAYISVIEPNDLLPDESILPSLSANCELTPEIPTATNNCGQQVLGVSDMEFPITTNGSSIITWTFEDDFGNTSSQIQNVYVSSIDNEVTADDYLLTAINGAYDYQWVDCDNGNSPIDGATSYSFTAPETGGSFAVEISNNQCTVVSDCITLSGLGTAENDFGKDFSVFPNPSAGPIHIQLGANYEAVRASVYNVAGQKLYESTVQHTDQLSFELEGEAGVYFIRLEADSGQSVFWKHIKQ